MAHLLLLFYVAVKCGVVSPNPQELIWRKVNKQRAGVGWGGVGSSGARGGKKKKKPFCSRLSFSEQLVTAPINPQYHRPATKFSH